MEPETSTDSPNVSQGDNAAINAPPRKQLSLMLLGSERSGTSFVQATLNKYYGISEGNESHWVIHGWRTVQQGNIQTQADQERFIKNIFAGWYFASKVYFHNIFFNHKDFVQEGPFDYPKFVQQVFQHIVDENGDTMVLNKTTTYCQNMAAVDEIFDSPAVMHIIRDGRDVAQQDGGSLMLHALIVVGWLITFATAYLLDWKKKAFRSRQA